MGCVMTRPGAPRVAMRANYTPGPFVLSAWRRGQTYETALGSLLRRVEVDQNECWLWKDATNAHDYGVASHWQFGNGLAHRFAWFVFHGRVADGLTLDHLCRVRHCVNPAHLEPVTMRENLHRSPLVIRSHCIRGHEYTPENTIRRKEGWRECRSCYRTRLAARRNAA